MMTTVQEISNQTDIYGVYQDKEAIPIFDKVLKLCEKSKSSTVADSSCHATNVESHDLNPLPLEDYRENTEAEFTHIQSLQGERVENSESVDGILVVELSNNVRKLSDDKRANRQGKKVVQSKMQCPVCSKEYVNVKPYEKHLKTHAELEESVSEDATAQPSNHNPSSEQGEGDSDDNADCRESSGEEYDVGENDEDDVKNHGKKTLVKTPNKRRPQTQRVRKVIVECKHCNEQFTNKQKYERHVKTHALKEKKSASHICPFCNRDMKKAFNLKKHIRTHTKERPFKCDQCGKEFASSDTLKVHKRRHAGDKPYKCIHCDKGFVKKSVLTDHLRIHSGEKPHVCEYCQRAFTQRPTLVEHLRIHTNEKPFKCDQCGKSFRFRNVLKSHLVTHTGIRPFNCNICGQGFVRNVLLMAHMKKQHSDHVVG